MLASLRHLQPMLSKLRDAGDTLAPGLNLLVSFPFPKEASEIVRGDYANTSIRVDINLEKVIKSPGRRCSPTSSTCAAPTAACRRPVRCSSPAQKACSGDITSRPARRCCDVDLLSPLRQQGLEARRPNPVCPTSAPPGPAGRSGGLPAALRQQPADSAVSSASAGGGSMIARHRSPPDRAFLVLSAVGHRLHRRAATSASSTGCSAAGSPCTRPCPPRAAFTRAARSPTAASRSARSPRCTRPATGVSSTSRSRTGTKLPLDTPMYVHNLSAVGEQYLDFEPPDDKPPYAKAGDTLARRRVEPADRRGRPADRAELVRRARSTSNDLSTVVGELGTMFHGTAKPLQRMLDNGQHVRRRGVRAHRRRHDRAARHRADRAADPGEARARTSSAFSRDLADLTEHAAAHRQGPPHHALQGGPPAVREVDSLLKELEPTLPVLPVQRW